MWWMVLLVGVIVVAFLAAPGGRLDRWMCQHSSGWRNAAERDAKRAAQPTMPDWMPCPRCGSKRVRYEKLVSGGQRAGMTMAGFFFPVYWIAALAAGARRKEFNCDDCRFEWNRAEAPADAGRIA